MMEYVINEYCYQRYENPLIQEIRLLYHTDENGKGSLCKVIFRDGTSDTYRVNTSAAYLQQYSVPISEDGTIMYVSDWNKGLTAYDTRSGNEIWRIKRPHIRMTHLFSDYGVTLQTGKSLIQFDCQTGAVRKTLGGEKAGKAIKGMYFLKDEMVLVYWYLGSACIIDCRSMTVKERIDPAVLNPHDCYSLAILNAYVKGNKVIVSGWEQGSMKEPRYKPQHDYERVIFELSDDCAQ